MRSLIAVIDQLLTVVPADQLGLRQELQKHKESALFTAPEAMRERWFDTAYALRHFIGDDANAFTDWQRQVIEIWKGATS